MHALRNPSKTYAGYPKAEAKKKITLMKVIFSHFYQKARGRQEGETLKALGGPLFVISANTIKSLNEVGDCQHLMVELLIEKPRSSRGKSGVIDR